MPTQSLYSGETRCFGWLKQDVNSLKGAGGANAVCQALAKSDAEQGDCQVLLTPPTWTAR